MGKKSTQSVESPSDFGHLELIEPNQRNARKNHGRIQQACPPLLR